MSDQSLINFRRSLHKIPEIGYREIQTTKLIADRLSSAGIEFNLAINQTGIIGEINKGAGKCILLRADIDALPISEDTGLSFSSVNEGLMHACGHDIHTTILVGVIENLKHSSFKGKIKFVFQPSEEGPNSDVEKKSGGQRIVENGIMEGVDYSLALHVHPLIEVGNLAYTLGSAMACSSFFTIKINGTAGHAGAAPHLSIDSLLATSNLIQNLNTIVSRNIDPNRSAVVSVTMINGGEAPNITAEKIVIRGTIRALELDDYNKILERMGHILEGISITFQVDTELTIDSYYPNVKNDKEVHSSLQGVISNIFNDRLLSLPPSLGGEDFSFYSHQAPSMFYFLGAKNVANSEYFLHHPKVVFNEACIKYGVDFLSKASLKLLS